MPQDREPASGAASSENSPEIDPFDPVALKEKLRDASARRERVLSMRRSQRQVNSQPQEPPPSPVEPDRPQTPRRRRGLFVVAIFVAGAGLGATAASLTSGSLLQQGLALIPPLSGEAGDGGLSTFVAVTEAPALGTIGASTLSPIVVGASDGSRPDLPTLQKIAALHEFEPSETPGFVPAARTVAGSAALPRSITVPAPPAIRLDASLAPRAPTRPEASRASIPPPFVSGAPVFSIPFAGSSRVYVNVPVSVSEEIAAATFETLSSAGLGEVFLSSVSIPISRTNVRYYHDADAVHAGRISELLEPASGDGGVEARDFTGYDPKPEPGTIEVWFAGDAPPARRRIQVATRAPSPVAAAPARGTGLFGAVRASLAGLMGSRDGPGASASTRGAGGPQAIARHPASSRAATNARTSSGGKGSAAAKSALGSAATPSRTATTRSTPAAPAAQPAASSDAVAGPSRRSAEPAVTKTANRTASPNTSGKTDRSSAGRGKSKAKEAGRNRSAKSTGRGKSASKGGGKDKGGKGSKAGKSASKGDGKGGRGKSSGGGKSGSKGGGKSKGGKSYGGKKK